MEVNNDDFTVCALHLMIKQRRIRQAGHVTHMGKQEKHIILRPHMRWEDNIKVYPMETACKDVKWIDSSDNSPIADFCGLTNYFQVFQQRPS
jgi:hypothetical protein